MGAKSAKLAKEHKPAVTAHHHQCLLRILHTVYFGLFAAATFYFRLKVDREAKLFFQALRMPGEPGECTDNNLP